MKFRSCLRSADVLIASAIKPFAVAVVAHTPGHG